MFLLKSSNFWTLALLMQDPIDAGPLGFSLILPNPPYLAFILPINVNIHGF